MLAGVLGQGVEGLGIDERLTFPGHNDATFVGEAVAQLVDIFVSGVGEDLLANLPKLSVVDGLEGVKLGNADLFHAQDRTIIDSPVNEGVEQVLVLHDELVVEGLLQQLVGRGGQTCERRPVCCPGCTSRCSRGSW